MDDGPIAERVWAGCGVSQLSKKFNRGVPLASFAKPAVQSTDTHTQSAIKKRK